ncbi:unnamed protein product [Paramecium sonneborni]|uniref:Uncharacterized protein n=1 Tax=Paramecium sonneborni TaxID=65129 RepID=A0A8S1PDS5_9CILI|nr:unnamed protein product [Paramecium sonneborni]
MQYQNQDQSQKQKEKRQYKKKEQLVEKLNIFRIFELKRIRI